MFPRLTALWMLTALVGGAATLEQLSEGRLIGESTEIVRGRVNFCQQTYRRPMIWTTCEVTVTERLKGPAGATVTVAVPGGTAAGLRQSYEGAPVLVRGTEYLFFLWEGKSGLKQLMGLGQGLFDVTRDSAGNLIAVRGKSSAEMRDARGNVVEDTGMSLSLGTLRQRVQGRLARGGAQ